MRSECFNPVQKGFIGNSIVFREEISRIMKRRTVGWRLSRPQKVYPLCECGRRYWREAPFGASSRARRDPGVKRRDKEKIFDTLCGQKVRDVDLIWTDRSSTLRTEITHPWHARDGGSFHEHCVSVEFNLAHLFSYPHAHCVYGWEGVWTAPRCGDYARGAAPVS